MRPHYEKFEATPFADSGPLIKPMLHCTTLLWANCRYYCKNARIVTLLRLTCNMVIEQCSKGLDTRSLLRGEPDDGHQKIAAVLKLLDLFKYVIITIYINYEFCEIIMKFKCVIKTLY